MHHRLRQVIRDGYNGGHDAVADRPLDVHVHVEEVVLGDGIGDGGGENNWFIRVFRG